MTTLYVRDVSEEVALGRLLRGGKLTPSAAEDARVDHFALSIPRHEIHPLAGRIWLPRHRYTSYDACYLALAEALEAPLYSRDAKLAGVGREAQVRVFPRTHGPAPPLSLNHAEGVGFEPTMTLPP